MSILKTSIKVFHKHKFYAGINIFGFSVGIALLLIIGLILNFDLGYDKHWSNADQIYRIDYKYSQDGTQDQLALASKFLPERLQDRIPEISGIARFSTHKKQIIRARNQLFLEQQIVFSDQPSLDLFNLEVLYGSENNLLNAPNQIIISEELANKWFDDPTDAINQTVYSSFYDTDLIIKSVFRDLPSNTHFKFNGLISYETLLSTKYAHYGEKDMLEDIWLPDATCYVGIIEGSSIEEVSNKSQGFIESEIRPSMLLNGTDESLELKFIPLSNTHFYDQSDFNQPIGNSSFISILTLTGLVILIIISINYTNLSMAILNQRQKELAMRKVLGATRLQLIIQIYLESLLSIFISLVIGISWVTFVDSVFSLKDLFGREITVFHLADGEFIFFVSLLILTISLLAVIYPSLKFTKPIINERGKNKVVLGTFNQVLIAVQFFSTFVVLTSMLLMHWQLNVIEDFDLGFEDDEIVSVEIKEKIQPSSIDKIIDQLSKIPQISLISDAVDSDESLMGIYNFNVHIEPVGTDKIERVYASCFVGVDYCELLNIDLLKGKYLDKNSFKLKEVMVNQTFANQYSDDLIINEPIHLFGRTYRIAGVVEDFHFKSLRSPVEPIILFPRASFTGDENAPIKTNYHFKIQGENKQETLNKIEATFLNTYPNQPFTYRYLSDKISSFYKEDQRDAYFITSLGLSIVIISVFGLLALVTFQYRIRTKQLSIKKILGAPTKSLFFDLNKKQLYVIIGTSFVSMPATYLFISDWLSDFSFTINFEWGLVAATLVSLVLVSILSALAMISKYLEIDRLNPAQILREN